MGIINCPDHGFTGITLVCPHIQNSFQRQEALMELTQIKEEFPLLGEGEYTSYWFCKECVEHYGLPTDGRILSSEEWNKCYFEASKILEPLCSKCFWKFKVLQRSNSSSVDKGYL